MFFVSCSQKCFQNDDLKDKKSLYFVSYILWSSGAELHFFMKNLLINRSVDPYSTTTEMLYQTVVFFVLVCHSFIVWIMRVDRDFVSLGHWLPIVLFWHFFIIFFISYKLVHEASFSLITTHAYEHVQCLHAL